MGWAENTKKGRLKNHLPSLPSFSSFFNRRRRPPPPHQAIHHLTTSISPLISLAPLKISRPPLSFSPRFLFKSMAGWQRHLQSLVRQVSKRYECGRTASFSTFHHAKAPAVSGQLHTLSDLQNSLYPTIARPLYLYLQKFEFTSSRSLLADASEGTPVSSPLIPVLPSSTGTCTAETQKSTSKPSQVQAILKKIKQSPKKVNLVAEFVRGMRVEDALLQLQVTVKRAAKTVYQVIHSARANATHNYGFDPDRLIVAEAFVGKGRFLKRVSYHSKGRHGTIMKPECRLTVVLREITPEEEAKIAKLKVHNYRKLSKREKRLVPHKLIESNPVWDRKGKARNQESRAMAA